MQSNALQAQTLITNRISKIAAGMIRFAKNWFTPRSDNVEMQFREKTIRLFLGFMLPLGLFIFVANFMWYGLDTITVEKLVTYHVLDIINIVGWPILTTIMLLLYFYSAWAVTKNRIKLAGDILVAAFMFFSTGVLVIETYYSPLTLPAFMVAILVCFVMISRNSIWKVTLLLLAVITAIVVVQHAAGFYPDSNFHRDPNNEGFAPVSWEGILLNIYTPLIG